MARADGDGWAWQGSIVVLTTHRRPAIGYLRPGSGGYTPVLWTGDCWKDHENGPVPYNIAMDELTEHANKWMTEERAALCNETE